VTSWAGRCVVGTVSHRPFPGLPSEVGERCRPGALTGRPHMSGRRENTGNAGSGDPAYTVTSWAGRCAVGTVSHRPFPGQPLHGDVVGWAVRGRDGALTVHSLSNRVRWVSNVGPVPSPGVRTRRAVGKIRWTISAAVRPHGRGAFGEIDLPLSCLGEVDFWSLPGGRWRSLG